MRERKFSQVDVFTAVPYKGNPVAVVLDGDGLSDAEMQAFANWTNLSETTFVLPPSDPAADYCVRIFTPKAELPFAGHPTLGTAHAVIEAGIAAPKQGKLVQQCAVGLVELTLADGALSFRLPRYAVADAPDPAEAVAWIGGAAIQGQAKAVDVGPVWLIVELAEIDALENLQHDPARLTAYYEQYGLTGATLYATAGDRVVVRSFAPGDGIPEDPVCGSGNGAVAAYRLAAGQIGDGSTYRASQGRQLGRDGWIDIRIDGTDIHVGGTCVTCVRGEVQL
ncbi:MAG: PhzF family phenazine biosynthesis protein [Novosphingobium sp.]